jgi:molecular chaperone DnaK
VSFDIDANGIVDVKAKDLGTGKEQQIKIQASSGLSESDIDTMIKEAELHAEKDQQKRSLVDIVNQADALIYQSEQGLKDIKEKISEETFNDLTKAIEQLKSEKATEDEEKIKFAMDNLNQKFQEASSKIYHSDQTQADAEVPNPSSSHENVVDAEYQDIHN